MCRESDALCTPLSPSPGSATDASLTPFYFQYLKKMPEQNRRRTGMRMSRLRFPASRVMIYFLTLLLICTSGKEGASGANFKCPSSRSVYHPCKCFTWDDSPGASTSTTSFAGSLSLGSDSLFLATVGGDDSETFPSEQSMSQPPINEDSSTNSSIIESGTSTHPTISVDVTTNHVDPLQPNNMSSVKDTEVEISCRTMETDEESLKALFERMHQYIYENGYMKRFTSLRIENTALSSLDGSDIFSGISFQSLDLFQNIDLDTFNLKSFEASRETLKTLLLQGSPFEGSLEFFAELSSFKRLETLILSNNRLTGLPTEVFGRSELSNLSYVDLSGNRITDIGPKSFFKLPNLQRITLDNNLIKKITNETFILEREDSKLLLIFLRNNNLTEDSIHPGTFSNMNQTVFLYLNSNQMTHLKEEVFKPMLEEKNDLFIALWSNPFICDCRSLWLLEDKTYLRKRLHGFKCTNFNKKEVWDLEPQHLKCGESLTHP